MAVSVLASLYPGTVSSCPDGRQPLAPFYAAHYTNCLHVPTSTFLRFACLVSTFPPPPLLQARLPFFDSTLDLVHCVNSVKYLPILEFEELLFEWDRVLRVGEWNHARHAWAVWHCLSLHLCITAGMARVCEWQSAASE